MSEMDKNSPGDKIPGMNLINNYSTKKPILPENSDKMERGMEKTKKELEKVKGTFLKKYPFIQSIGILPAQTIKIFVEDEMGPIPEAELSKIQKKIHLYIIIPEEKFKEIPKLKKEMIAELDKAKQNVWLYLKTPVDIWEACLDSKFEIADAVGMSYPLYDKGLLSSLRVAEIHKSLVLQKFDKYVVSYVIAGSLVRDEATKESDVDSFIIINDTDVKRMPRLELKERLRGMIHQYISEATALAGVKKEVLNVQIYLLTDFWESVKDAHPVMFTFIRDGVPLYDKGTFLPWKALLKMGRLKPSPEAIDMFMSMGDKTIKRAKATFLDILVHDVYWGVLTPSQALLMLYGLPPPTPKQTTIEMKKIFVNKEKMLEKKYVTILENIVRIYKDYEHEKVKEIKGAELDKLLKDMDDYLGRLKELRKQIEKRSQEKTIEQIHKDIIGLLQAIIGKKPQATLVSEFEKLVKEGKFTQQHSRILEEVIKARSEFKRGKLNAQKVDEARKKATLLINDLLDYSQRADLAAMEKGKMRIQYKKAGKPAIAEVLHCSGVSFLFKDNEILKLTFPKGAAKSSMTEVQKTIENQNKDKPVKVSPKIFELIKKELGEFEIVL